ncbi:MAG: alpha-N-acetylglucosaminidase [Puniceicoccales bacterium]|nr:alpha-N-acetylglucosaminidase [Puniceicoccales bacterium]
MKKFVSLLATMFLVCASAHGYPAVDGLLQRLLPGHKTQFILEDDLPKTATGTDIFEIEQRGGKVVVRGSSPVAQSSGIGWYLRHVANCEMTWDGDQLNLSKQLPAVAGKIRQETPYKYRAYFNYCTLSYTGAWWDWARWEREIDLMALNGINMPLSVIGLESVWYKTLLQFGFSDAEAREFIAGPAFFAWQWMTNLENFAGPIPKTWLESHEAMGRKIVEREREFDMTPIQQGFTGFVPIRFKEKFPNAAIKQQPSWGGSFPGSAQLDPLDPLFPKLAKVFYAEQKKAFGAYGFYGTDPFHESSPPQPGNEYLSNVGKAIYKAATDADPNATLCVQSWSLRMPIIQAVPKEHLLVLDIGGKGQGNAPFDGYPFVRGIIHNFGGRTRMFGRLNGLAQNPFFQTKKRASNNIGMGLFPEAIHNNPVYYGMAFDLIWREGAVGVPEWVSDYAKRRYGAETAGSQEAWEILLKTVYSTDARASSFISARPALNAFLGDPNDGFKVPYDPNELLRAWVLLLNDSEKLSGTPGYSFDVVDIGRQLFSDLAIALHSDVALAYLDKDKARLNKAAAVFQEMLQDVDGLMKTNPFFSFEKWTQDARKWATNDAERKIYDYNATVQVTQWGHTGSFRPTNYDYAWKEWSGLIRDYYLPRWKFFHEALAQSLDDGSTWPDETKLPRVDWRVRYHWRSTPFYDKLADWELEWINAPRNYPPYQAGDSAGVARKLLQKYKPLLAEKFASNPMESLQEVRRQVAGNQVVGGKPVFHWKPADCSLSPKTWRIDVTKEFGATGDYEVTFLYEKGAHRLEIKEVKLLQSGTEASVDKHDGMTGNDHVRNVYKLNRTDPIIGAKYELEITANTDGGTNSNGTVYVKLVD